MTTRILLVEDNPSDVELVRTAFEEAGITAEFTIFRDGDEAIAGVRRIAQEGPRPDLALLDLNLPRTSGHEVLACVRGLDRFDQMPVVVFSTSNHPADRARCIAGGADDYQVKPPRFADLLELVQLLRARWLAGSP